jgi:cobalt-zinc-cadmium efflux system membrane fusion protein
MSRDMNGDTPPPTNDNAGSGGQGSNSDGHGGGGGDGKGHEAPPPETTETLAAAEATRPPTPRRLALRRALLLTVLGALTAAAAGLALRGGDAPAAPGPAAPPSAAAPVKLAAGAQARNPVRVAPAESRKLAGDIQVVGTVSFHEDHFAVVGPLVAGRISRLVVGVGDRVARGQVIAEIESSEVGQARADLIAARARYDAAEANLRRERDLAEKKIASSRDRETAEAQWGTERAGVRAATLRLRAIGLTPGDIADLEKHDRGGQLPIRAPIAGTVVERLVTLGQAVERATDAFKIADTSQVWVTLDLYEKDLARVFVGQRVEMRTESRPAEPFVGRVAFIVPLIDETTRTAKVRLELPNPSGALNAGQLVTARIVADTSNAAREVVAVPRSAIEQVEGKTIVFVQTDGGFVRRTVEVGVSDGDRVEIRAGLAAGEPVVVEGAFLLKSELLR